jgi:hypothetical protein
LVYYSTLKIEATCSSETSDEFHRTRRRCTPEDRALHETAVRAWNHTQSSHLTRLTRCSYVTVGTRHEFPNIPYFIRSSRFHKPRNLHAVNSLIFFCFFVFCSLPFSPSAYLLSIVTFSCIFIYFITYLNPGVILVLPISFSHLLILSFPL